MVSNRERLEELHEEDRRKAKRYVALIIFAMLVIVATFIYARWPHSNVTVVGNPYIIGPTKIEQGGIVVWQRQEVCIPEGTTHVTRYAEQLDEKDPRIQLDLVIPGFTLKVTERVCFNPSVTPVILPNYIGPGEWRIRVETLTESPTGSSDAKSVSFGPPFTVVSGKGDK